MRDIVQGIKRLCAAAIVCLFFGLTGPGVFAQTWSAEQREVLETVDIMRRAVEGNDTERFMSFIHKDFSGWGTVSALPTDKEFRRRTLSNSLTAHNEVVQVITPLAVVVHGDAAIVHSHIVTVERVKNSGESRTRNTVWTDIYVREGGRWLLIADHGRLLD